MGGAIDVSSPLVQHRKDLDLSCQHDHSKHGLVATKGCMPSVLRAPGMHVRCG